MRAFGQKQDQSQPRASPSTTGLKRAFSAANQQAPHDLHAEREQMKPTESAKLGETAGLPIVHEVLATPGQPLDPSTRGLMEARFSYDFSRVRVHADVKAAESASSLSAKAYTVGSQIVFGENQYLAHTSNGQHLLAHELAHVIQQSRGGTTAPRIDGRGPGEADAKRAADAAVNTTGNAVVTHASAPGIAADPEKPYRSPVTPELLQEMVDEIFAARRTATPPSPSTPAEARRTFAVAAIINPQGKRFMMSRFFDSGDALHAEEKVLGEIRSKKLTSAGSYTVLLIDQVPCGPNKHDCKAQLLTHAKDPKSGSLRVFTTRLFEDPFKSPKTAIRRGLPSTVGAAPEVEFTRVRLPVLQDEPSSVPSTGAPKSVKAPAVKATPVTPKTGSTTASVQKVASQAADTIEGDLKLLRAAKVLSAATSLLSFISSLKMFDKFSNMATSGLAGTGFVLTKEVAQAKSIREQAESLQVQYQKFSESLGGENYLFIQAGQDPHTARTASRAIAKLLANKGDFNTLVTGLPKRISSLSKVIAEAQKKRDKIDEILEDPPLIFGDPELAELIGVSEDLQIIASSLSVARDELRKVRKSADADNKWLEAWNLTLLRVCFAGGVCSFLD